MTIRGILFAATFTAAAMTAATGIAQVPPPAVPGAAPPGEVVVGSGNYSPVVQDLDKAIEFYGNLLGLTVPAAPAPGPRPFSTDPAIRNMFGMPGAQLRWVVARVPVVGLRLCVRAFKTLAQPACRSGSRTSSRPSAS